MLGSGGSRGLGRRGLKFHRSDLHIVYCSYRSSSSRRIEKKTILAVSAMLEKCTFLLDDGEEMDVEAVVLESSVAITPMMPER
jgi:hypothetical protein